MSSQDLSVAGKRAGLAGERSGLFMEQIRVVKEMRDADARRGRTGIFIRPRYMVWENVVGALSSNKGEDFGVVLTETVRIAEPDAPAVPVPAKGWSKSGFLCDELGRWSVAWRVHDAQFWGVPQRRKRIALLADFGGLSAGEILFDAQLWRETTVSVPVQTFRGFGGCAGQEVQSLGKSVSGDFEPGGTEREEAAGGAGGGAYPAIANTLTARYDGSPQPEKGNGANIVVQEQPTFCIQGNCIDRADTAGCNGRGWCEDVSYTLNTIDRPAVCAGFSMGQSEKARSIGWQEEVSPTLRGGEGGNQKPCVLAFAQNQRDEVRDLGDTAGSLAAEPGMKQLTFVYDARGNGDGEVVPTVTGDHNGHISDYTALCVGNGQLNQISMSEKANTLDTMHDQQAVLVPEVAHTPKAKGNVDMREDSETYICQSAVRRLTPLETERLQGFPGGWTDIGDWTDSKGKTHHTSDSARYKALGNSIALPFWQWLLRRIAAQYERQATLGSLFDGISGFPLCQERCGGKAVWSSEVEEFCIAVAKRHFGEQ